MLVAGIKTKQYIPDFIVYVAYRFKHPFALISFWIRITQFSQNPSQNPMDLNSLRALIRPTSSWVSVTTLNDTEELFRSNVVN